MFEVRERKKISLPEVRFEPRPFGWKSDIITDEPWSYLTSWAYPDQYESRTIKEHYLIHSLFRYFTFKVIF